MCVLDFSKPVAVLSGEEFRSKEGKTFAQQVNDFFIDIGGYANSPYGRIILDNKGIQADKAHGIGRIKAASFAAIKQVLEHGVVILPLGYYATGGKKQMTSMIAAPILIGNVDYICVVVIIDNLKEKRLYLHETFLKKEIPETAASSLVRDSKAVSPQSRGDVAKVLQNYLINKSNLNIPQ